MKKLLASRVARVVIAVGAVHLAHWRLREVAGAIARSDGVLRVIVEAVAFVAGALACGLAVRWLRDPPKVQPALVIASVIVSLVPAYALQLAQARTAGEPLPSIGFHAPGSTDVERYPGRPRVTYRFNDRRFRGPNWPTEGPRLCIVGDSYVFGSGVEWEDTLGESLRRELGVVVLNLGVPGHNLGSHVTLAHHAARTFSCDVIVLALTLPNDLAAWDINTEHQDRASISAYSLAELIVGREIPALVANTRELPMSIDAPGLDVLASEWERLGSLRVPLLVLAYSQGGALRTLPVREGQRILESPPRDDTWFIPGDGHPNARGNTAYGELLARTIREDPRFARPLGL